MINAKSHFPRTQKTSSFADCEEPKDSEFTIRNNKERELIHFK